MSLEQDVKLLGCDDLGLMNALLEVFGQNFGELETYVGKRPSAVYMRRLLASDDFIALVAHQGGKVVAGLAAYELKKFEQERSEVYLYDLAVAAEYRRQGIATALIHALRGIAAKRGAYVIFVQADTGPEDEAAIALYSKLGIKENVLHFDIPVSRS
ncbi:aminoglycoside 3-N-acetyltransferase I [Modicisalibacter muralis]|uniref:Aminoglycoside 3-N-acetyltransferase I n=1 Tax=Modicisalibacter muralis TaxID=119000 RepID=A0A1G9M623_9GAMM|nr:AAC(3)-I family aminoglycoside N-acetyltransferase [Halomonas muralis]SDL69145.1 aminoglycoside 3-N-acetyltransferase I [Halomonas muralis]